MASRKRVLGLDVDLPGAAEQVEVVDVVAAERGLQGGEDVAHLDAQHLRLVAVDVEIDLRRVGGEGGEDAGELGLLVGRHDAWPRMTAARSVGDWPCRACSTYWKPPVLPRPRIGGRLKGKAMAPWMAASLRPQAGDDGVDRLAAVGALLVGFQAHDEEGAVGRRDVVDEVQADDRQHALHAGDRPDDVLDLLDQVGGAVERGALGQSHGGEEGALVLRRQEALRRDPEHADRPRRRRRRPRRRRRRRAAPGGGRWRHSRRAASRSRPARCTPADAARAADGRRASAAPRTAPG